MSGVFLPFTDFSAEGGFNCWWIRLQMHHFSMGNSQKTLKLVTELAKHPGCCPNLAEVCFQLRTTGDLLFYLVCHLDTFLLPLKKDGFIHFRELEWKTIRYSLHCSSSISRIKLILSIQRLEILLSVDCKECKVLPFVVSLVLCFHPVKKKVRLTVHKENSHPTAMAWDLWKIWCQCFSFLRMIWFLSWFCTACFVLVKCFGGQFISKGFPVT